MAVLSIISIFVTVVGLIITWVVRSKRVRADQPFVETFQHYTSVKMLHVVGKIFRSRLVRVTKNVAKTQASFLTSVIRENADTRYGAKYGFKQVNSVEDFKSMHPLTRYSHFAPYVQRMLRGEKEILTKKQPEIFGVSSGTSGGSKVIPMVKRQKSLFFLHAVSVLYACLMEAYPQVTSRLRKSLKIFYTPRWRTTKTGVIIGPSSSNPTSQKNMLHMYTTPAPAFDILSEPDALYVHLLFALKDRHLGMIEGNFASLVYNAMVTLQRNLQQLLGDIRQGTLNPNLNIPAHTREDLEKLLQPDPARAQEIEQAFQEGVTGVCRRVWPELGLVLTVDSGSFKSYADKLRSTFCQGVPLYSALYAATEGLIGINLWPEDSPSRYLPHPSVQFLEFIPVENSHLEQPATLLLHQLEEGQEYEVVLTNVSGLYRYRLGDVVRVTGFYNQCPVFEFLYRIGQFLNVRGEKTSESLFYDTLRSAVAQWSDFTLVDYCCAESVLVDDVHLSTDDDSSAPCYHVFLEVESRNGHGQPSEDQKRMIDDQLCHKSYVYSSFRNKGSIDVMKVHVLRQGAFQEFRQHVIHTTAASSNQFKVPRVLKKKGLAEFLLSREFVAGQSDV